MTVVLDHMLEPLPSQMILFKLEKVNPKVLEQESTVWFIIKWYHQFLKNDS